VVEIKFCGMTRPEDVREAGALRAAFVGAILAESPRRLSDADAKRVLGAAPSSAKRVAVFGAEPTAAIASAAERAGVDVAQLHGDPTVVTVTDLRSRWKGMIWAVVRVDGTGLPASADALFDVADAVVLDAKVEGKLGGTGVTLAWHALGPQLAPLRGKRARLVLAGGLSPENVGEAVKAIRPDIVDVSSGVESSVGVKDHARMRAFRDAVNGASR
jgi:phosphoribosylanthranilate isomerase